MKYKLTTAERAERIEQRAKARADKAGRVDAFRDWFEARRAAARKRNTEAAKAPRGPRGVDRVPARYVDEEREVEYLVQHTTPSRAMRRRTTKSKPGRPLPRLREQRAARLEYAVGEALVGRHFVTDEGEQAAVASVRRWAR